MDSKVPVLDANSDIIRVVPANNTEPNLEAGRDRLIPVCVHPLDMVVDEVSVELNQIVSRRVLD